MDVSDIIRIEQERQGPAFRGWLEEPAPSSSLYKASQFTSVLEGKITGGAWPDGRRGCFPSASG